MSLLRTIKESCCYHCKQHFISGTQLVITANKDGFLVGLHVECYWKINNEGE